MLSYYQIGRKFMLAIILSIEKILVHVYKKFNLFFRDGEGERFSKNGTKGV